MNFWNYNKDIGIELNRNLGNTNTHQSITDLMVSDFIDFSSVTEKNEISRASSR